MATTGEARALPFFVDLYGRPLEAGSIYIGEAGLDPVANPVNVYSDAAGSALITQPVRTMHGIAVSGGSPVHIFVPLPYSITILDSAGRVVYTSLNETDPISVSISQSSVQSASSLAALRARDKNSTNQVWVDGYGLYVYQPSDTTSPENLPDIVVASDAGRYYLWGAGIATQAQFDSSPKPATDAFVQRALGNDAGLHISKASETLSAAHAGFLIVGASSSAITDTLPAAASLAPGVKIHFFNGAAGLQTAQRSGADSINVAGASKVSLTLGQGDSLTLETDGVSTWYAIDGTVTLQYATALQLINNTNATSDIALAVGQGAYIDVSAATTVPLHIACGDNQAYEIETLFTGSTGTITSTSCVLLPNNATVANKFWVSGFISSGLSSTYQGGYEPGFAIAYNNDLGHSVTKVSTKTISKSTLTLANVWNGSSLYLAAYTTRWLGTASSTSAGWDTTTPWTSLGTLTLGDPATGRIIIRRIA